MDVSRAHEVGRFSLDGVRRNLTLRAEITLPSVPESASGADRQPQRNAPNLDGASMKCAVSPDFRRCCRPSTLDGGSNARLFTPV